MLVVNGTTSTYPPVHGDFSRRATHYHRPSALFRRIDRKLNEPNFASQRTTLRRLHLAPSAQKFSQRELAPFRLLFGLRLRKRAIVIGHRSLDRGFFVFTPNRL